MYLGPHHFQAQSAYFEGAIHFTGAALWFEPWGFLACELDTEALRNGTAALIHARGIFPDGLAFQMPECDPLPPARPIADLIPPTRDRVTLSLGIPDYKPTGVNLESNGDGWQVPMAPASSPKSEKFMTRTPARTKSWFASRAKISGLSWTRNPPKV